MGWRKWAGAEIGCDAMTGIGLALLSKSREMHRAMARNLIVSFSQQRCGTA